MRGTLCWGAIVLAPWLLSGCGMNRMAAARSLAEAESTFDEVADRAIDVAPEQARQILGIMRLAEGDLARGDHKAVLVEVRELNARTRSLAETMPALQQKLEAEWKGLEQAVPGELVALRSSIDAAAMRKPRGRGPELNEARAALSQLSDRWSEAQVAMQSGRLAEAVNRATDVRHEAIEQLARVRAGF